MIWPTGDSAKMRLAAAAWLTAGTNFDVTEIQGTGGVLGRIRAQQIPEGGMIDAALTDVYESTTRVVGSCQAIADQLNSYAGKVDKVHAAILDLLSRICDPLTGFKKSGSFSPAKTKTRSRRSLKTYAPSSTISPPKSRPSAARWGRCDRRGECRGHHGKTVR